MSTLKSLRVSARYATALFEIAVESNQLEVVKNDMKFVVDLVQASRDLLLVFRSPLVNVDKKVRILETLFKTNVCELTFSFLKLVTRKGRIIHLDAISDSFLKMYLEFNKIKMVYVDSTAPLDQNVQDVISQKLAEHTKYKIDLKTKIDETLIGGFRVRYDDFLYDLSLKKKFIKQKYG